MKKACIIKAHTAGLWSLINKVITCSEMYDEVRVDLSNSIYGTENVWDHLFISGEPNEISSEVDVIDAYPHQNYTAKNAHFLYVSGHQYWRKSLHQQWNKFSVNPEHQKRAEDFCGFLLGNYQAVIVRSFPHAGEQMTGKEPELQRYAEQLDPAIPVFVMSNDWETQEWFSNRFESIRLQNTRRCKSRDIEFHLSTPQTIEDAIHCFIEVLICSGAKTLVHGVSNMATAALYINPRLKSIYLP
jgi:hypothetical protein